MGHLNADPFETGLIQYLNWIKERKVNIFLTNETKLDEPFRDNPYLMSDNKFVRKDWIKSGSGFYFILVFRG